MSDQDHDDDRRTMNRAALKFRKALPDGYEYLISVSKKGEGELQRGFYFSDMSPDERGAHLERLTKVMASQTDAPDQGLADKRNLAGELVEYLNGLAAIDPAAVLELVETRALCNDGLQRHPTVQVSRYEMNPHYFEVGMVGILNGFVGTDDSGQGFIQRIVDDEDPAAISFCVAPE